MVSGVIKKRGRQTPNLLTINSKIHHLKRREIKERERQCGETAWKYTPKTVLLQQIRGLTSQIHSHSTGYRDHSLLWVVAIINTLKWQRTRASKFLGLSQWTLMLHKLESNHNVSVILLHARIYSPTSTKGSPLTPKKKGSSIYIQSKVTK